MFKNLISRVPDLVSRLEIVSKALKDDTFDKLSPSQHVAWAEVDGWLNGAQYAVKQAFGEDSDQYRRWIERSRRIDKSEERDVQAGRFDDMYAIIYRIKTMAGLLTEFQDVWDVQFRKLEMEKKDHTAQPKDVATILFLAADPTDESRLRLGQELRDIRHELQLSKNRSEFNLQERTSVRVADISRAIHDVSPRIVHFSGHGRSAGALCFENEVGKAHDVQPDALAALFKLVAGQVECVVINACYSNAQAEAIAKYIKYVVGMNQAIGDEAAIAFAVGFYQAIGAGVSYEEAYNFGCVQIRLQGVPEHLTPVLIKRH